MKDEMSPAAFALLWSSFTLVGVGLVLFFVELPFAVLNTFFGAFAIALGLAAVEFFVIKNVMT